MPIHVSRGSHAGSESCHNNQCRFLEVTTGFEPVTYNAFAERPLKPLEYVTILEQDTRFELALSVWKTDVLAADTNPANF